MLLYLLGGGSCDPACSGSLTLLSQDHRASVTCSLYFQIPSMHSRPQVYIQTDLFPISMLLQLCAHWLFPALGLSVTLNQYMKGNNIHTSYFSFSVSPTPQARSQQYDSSLSFSPKHAASQIQTFIVIFLMNWPRGYQSSTWPHGSHHWPYKRAFPAACSDASGCRSVTAHPKIRGK